jgi:two-component system cell cycle sensor histidine kinase PleC
MGLREAERTVPAFAPAASSSRPAFTPWLAGALISTFALGVAWRVNDERQSNLRNELDGQALRAELAAERANSQIVQAWGALAAAVDAASASGLMASNPRAVAAAAAKANAVLGVVVIGDMGTEVANSRDGLAPLARAAVEEARLLQTPVWSGVVTVEGYPTTLALSRRAGAMTVVTLMDTTALLPADNGEGRLMITTEAGDVLAAMPGVSQNATLRSVAGVDAISLSGDSKAQFGADGQGQKLAVGMAAATGGLRIAAAAPVGFGTPEMLRLILMYALLLAAPGLAAAGALYAHARGQRVRAEIAEEKLDRAQRHFRVAVDGARAGVWTWRPGDGMIELSPRLQQMLAAPEANFPVGQFIALAGKEDRAHLQTAFIQARETGALEVSFRIQRDNRIHWVELRGVLVAEDGVVPAMVGTALDVTPRREAELRTVALEKRLKEAIDSFSGPFALFDGRRRLVTWNTFFANQFQIPPQMLRRGATYDSISVAMSAALRQERSDPRDPQTREVELGDGRWLQLVERATGENGVVLVGVDITALKRHEENLTNQERHLSKAVEELQRSEARAKELKKRYEQEKHRAEEASRAKTAFLANMSHELRTPLNAINGFSEIMANEILGPLGTPKYREYAKDIWASGELLLDMINDILDMAKIEAGKLNLAPRPLDPAIAIDQAVRLLRRRAEEKGLQLVVDAHNLPEIEADHRAVKQMLLNLLSNAVKFTEAGGVVVQARPQDDGVLIQVVDTGPGIPPEALPRLARPFEQVDVEYTRTHGGTGLGLALTKTFAELHGGRFDIDSEVGKGTVVTIWLPKRSSLSVRPLEQAES